ncbi:PAS domain S-box protein [Natronomonas sp. EA1]|uniref:PAS domain S-box protein n=1 Tax=Natronomonas sp. EA1 TaxID=3421655 RepID=UPI003EC0EDBA
MSSGAVICLDSVAARAVAAVFAPEWVREVSSVDAVDAETVGCVLLTPRDGWERDVRTLRARAPDLPVILTGSADPKAGAIASRLGVEYAPEEAFDDGAETLGDRVVAALDRSSYELERERREEQLPAACDRYEEVLERVEDGFFAVNDDWEFTYLNEGGYEVIQAAAAAHVDFEELPGQNLWTVVPDAIGTAFEEHYRGAMATQQPTSFEAYYDPLDTWFGVTAYPSSDGLSVFFNDITERKQRETALNELLSTTQELMNADDREAIADIVCAAAADVLGLSLNAVRLYDADRDRLVSAAVSAGAREQIEELPTYAPGEGLSGMAFARGEALDSEAAERTIPDSYGEIVSAFVIPLGNYGTLSVGTTDPGGIDEDQRTLARILAANAEAALDRAERIERLQQYRAIHENVREMVYVLDDRGSLQVATDALLDRLGYDRAAVEGTHVSAFLTSDALATGERHLAALRASDEESRTIDTTLTTADGETFPVEVELSTLPDGGSVGVVRDQSELKRERSRFSSLFARTPDAIVDIIVTSNGPYVQRVNAAFTETFGIDNDDAVGEPLNDLIVPERDVAGARKLDTDAEQALTEPVEVTRQTPSGPRTFLFRAVQHGSTEQGPRMFGIYTDITEREADQQRIAMLNRVLRHNLRNTNTVVEGYLKMVLEAVDGKTETFARRALDGVERTNRIVEKVRTIERALDRADDGDRRVDLAGLVADASEAARERNPDVTVETTVEPVDVVGGDLLRTALVELAENAALHAGDAPHVTFDATVSGERVRLRIEDDGDGIPVRERNVLTGAQDITQLQHSRGLGLWLAKYVVESVGGELSFADGGRTVVLELPRAAD